MFRFDGYHHRIGWHSEGAKAGHVGTYRHEVVSELKHTTSEISPVSVTVLAAALVEGALTFVVKHGRSLNLGVFASPDFDGIVNLAAGRLAPAE